MPDVFDEISTEPKADVFDEIAPDKPKNPTIAGFEFKLDQLKQDWSPEKMGELGQALQTSPLQFLPRIKDPEHSTLSSLPQKLIAPWAPDSKLTRKIGAGVIDSLQGGAEFATTPAGMALTLAGGMSPLAGRAIAAGFVPLMTKQASEKLGEASVTKDPRTATEGALLAAMGGAAAKHAATSTGPKMSAEQMEKVVDDTIPKATPEPVQPKEPVTDIFDEVAAEPVVVPKVEPVDEVQKPVGPTVEKTVEPSAVPPSQPEVPSERIVAAAFRGKYGKWKDRVWKTGAFHDADKLPKSLQNEEGVVGVEPGFVTSSGKFLNRWEAGDFGRKNGQVKDQYPAHEGNVILGESEVATEPTSTPLESINRSPLVKLTTPEGATSLRGTDAKGRTSVQPISTISKGNPFQGADIVKLEAGTIDKTGKFKPIEGEVEVKEIPKSMGGQNPNDPGEIMPAQLAQLTSSITKLEEAAPDTEPSKAFSVGEAIADAKDSASSALSGLKAAGQYLAHKFEGKPVWTEMKEAVGDRHLALSESVHNARKFTERALKEMPDKELQDAISNWVDTGGDEARLGAAATESKGKYKAGYERALRLTPDQKLFAENIKNYFEARLDEAQKAGILEDGIENYIHRVYEADSGFKRGVLAELGSGLSTAKPGLAKQRVFEYDFEAERAGLKPIKSFIKRVAAYDLALNKAIADRAAVKAMMEIRMADGRPAIDVAGLGTKTIPDAEGASATFINPKWKPSDVDTPAKFRGDYRSIDAPALRKWKWVSADDKGNPTFVQGDVLVHPDAYKQVNALVGRSAIRSNPLGRAALNTGATVKQTMLDLSLFHPVQIAVHGFEHRSFFPAKEIDFTNPDVRGLIKGGMVVGETSGRSMFDEGLAGSSLTKHIPGLGPKVVALKDWIFQSYIPRLKVSTGLHALERNRARFPKLSEAEVNHLTANQMNRAFGELNYEMMARNKTAQDVFRLTALAPDFLEARAGFVAQALTKYGREQTTALLYGAAAMYILARVMNKLIDGQYHMDLKDAFSVVHKGKAYGLRTVQGDVIHAGTDFMHFLRNRLNPAITRPVLEALTGRDEFGRKRTAKEQAVDYVATAIPISVKGAFQGREKTLFESLLNSTGLTVRRADADSSIGKKMRDWKDANKATIKHAPGEFVYDPADDKYRGIKLAARAGDLKGTQKEIQAAMAKGLKYSEIIKYFHNSTTKPLTGSRKNDALFKKTLSADDLKTFDEARKERLKIYQTVRQAVR